MSAELVQRPDINEVPRDQRAPIITAALEESKAWLAIATTATDPTPIVEFKQWAATVAEMTRQKGLAEEIQLDALEMVRRAERGIGLSIRNGQASGEIRIQNQAGVGPQRDYLRNGRPVVVRHPVAQDNRLSPMEAAQVNSRSTLSHAFYAVTDGISDEQFENSIDAARGQGDLSRNNVLRNLEGTTPKLNTTRKVEIIREKAAEGHTSQQIAPHVGISDNRVRHLARQNDIDIPADRLTYGRRHIDPERVIGEAVHSMEGLTYALNLLSPTDYSRITPDQARNWGRGLAEPLRGLRQLMKELKTRADEGTTEES